MSWNSLPAELRLAMLEGVAGPNPDITKHEPRGYNADNAYAWAPYAAVSREWQDFFERRTFAALVLSSDGNGNSNGNGNENNNDVEVFRTAMTRCPDRLAYIGRLQLIIDLPAFWDYHKRQAVDKATMDCYDRIFTRSLWSFLHALSAWKAPRNASQLPDSPLWMRDDAVFRAGTFTRAIGMQLELGVRCTKDWTLWNHHFPLPDQAYRNEDYSTRTHLVRQMGVTSRSHGFDFKNRIYQATVVVPAHFQRVLGERFLVLGRDPGTPTRRRRGRRPRQMLPVAAVVRKLVLGHRFQRSIHPATVQRLLKSFPCVQSAVLEPWRPVTAGNRNILMRGYGRMLESLPPSLDRLCVFVESDCMLHYCERYPDPGTPPAQPPPSLGEAVAQASRRLAVLSAAFLAEAEDVFAAVAQMPVSATWPRLRTLILTSSTLLPDRHPAAIAQLLLAAAATAARMTRLRQLELWFSRGPHACVFTVDGGTTTTDDPRLRFQATWQGAAAALTEDVRRAWRAVVAVWTPRDLTVLVARTPKTVTWRRVLDARKMVLAGDGDANAATLVREAVFEQSRQDMARDRIWDRSHDAKRLTLAELLAQPIP